MYLVFDIGGTNTRIATADSKTLSNMQTFPTEKEFETQLELMGKVAKDVAGSEKIEAASGGVAGILSKEKDVLISSPHLASWIQRPLKEELEANLDAPIYLENDAHLGGLGEACFGAGKEYRIVVYLTIGTGIGGVRIVDQKIDNYSSGFEPGHQIVSLNGERCDCGGRGHLETYVAGAYLEKLYPSHPNWDEISKYLAIGLNNSIVHWSSDMVILGGAISQKIPLDKLQSYLNDFLKVFPAPKINKGSLGNQATLYGALQLITSSS